MTVDAKTELRRRTLSRRDLVSHEEAHAASLEVAERALALVRRFAPRGSETGEVVSVYWPIRSELNTRPLLEILAAEKIATALPVMTAVKRPLIFRAFTPGDDLMKGPFGLSEPAETQPSFEPDIVFSPLAAFDRKGYRLGYGGGIYDATLSQLRAKKRIVAVGVAYACQETDSVPTEPHDQKLDFLLTERELIEFS
ncbi:5-formyltetrahydrofolate cyclo-ligase [Methylosinus sp. R-45379]|uniref:5-formyltetrahydrofolate cyclo-ligase n=1 Tax=unclassified Methylosinus TaxID=2624500 RepID=UPI0004675F2D|nr:MULTISPECIES: 5-formyltetrahydrofolate cyclo-ligase [unclassified Methylosinus]OAI25262.1 5-formyltetrahydrofolate cyclo-ligase [Methylosinus sp. R-45379]